MRVRAFKFGFYTLYMYALRKGFTANLRVGSLVGRAPDQDPLTACTARGWGFVLVTFVARSGFEEVRVGTQRAAVSVHSTRRPFPHRQEYKSVECPGCSMELEEEVAAMTLRLLAPEESAARETTIPWMAASPSDGGSKNKT